MASAPNPHKHTITKIPYELWDEVVSVLPKEKPENTTGRPIVPYRKEWMASCISLEQEASGSCCLKNTVPVPPAIGGFKNGFSKTVLEKNGLEYWRYMMTKKVSSGHGNNPLTAYQ